MISSRTLAAASVLIGLAYFFNEEKYDYKLQDRALAEYDYIIVGAGTSGCVLASRLSEDRDVTVLLLEAGTMDTSQPLHDVPMATRSLMTTNLTWGGLTVPQEEACLGMNDRQCRVLRGKSLGGSTTINSLIYQRGSRHDYDQWEQLGATGWGYEDVLPYFIKAETNNNHDLSLSGYHGTGGPLIVSDVRSTTLPEAFVIAGKQLGYDALDINGESQQGFTHTQATVRRGRRWSVARGYLLPAMDRKNLHLMTDAMVHKVLFNGSEAVGVEFRHNGSISRILARREIILAAGAIGTPHILLLSGVGPKQHLTDIGVPMVADLPVGMNLQDHVTLRDQEYILKEPVAITTYKMSSIWAWFDYVVFGTGWWSSVLSEGSAFLTTQFSECDNRADIQISMAPILIGNDPATITLETAIHNYNEELYTYLHAGRERQDGFGLYVTLLRPHSHGTVTLQSPDPRVPPLVHPKYLSHPDDVKVLIEGVHMAEKLSATDMLKLRLGARRLVRLHPRCKVKGHDTADYWECYIRHNAVPEGHYSGTCRMGQAGDDRAVVNPNLSVHKVQNLRVVDASIMPTITAGNTYIPTVMVAEKAADLIQGKITVVEPNITQV